MINDITIIKFPFVSRHIEIWSQHRGEQIKLSDAVATTNGYNRMEINSGHFLWDKWWRMTSIEWAFEAFRRYLRYERNLLKIFIKEKFYMFSKEKLLDVISESITDTISHEEIHSVLSKVGNKIISCQFDHIQVQEFIKG